MQEESRIKENWLTKKPHEYAVIFAFIFSLIVMLFSIWSSGNFERQAQDFIASKDLVFEQKQYWRLWTTLFIHADWEHLLNNLLLLTPLSFLIFGYFGFFAFPILGIFAGGLINIIVLKLMPLQGSIVGISGVVYWMGAVWLTLFFLIDRRRSARHRFANILFLILMLFMPQNFKPDVSYLSHFLGFVFGIFSALLIYRWRLREFKSAEIREIILEEAPAFEELDPQTKI